jgi:hypothetical protein
MEGVFLKEFPPEVSFKETLSYILFSNPIVLPVANLCLTLQRQNADNLKQIFPEKEYRGLSPIFHIHVSVSELYVPTMGLHACSARGNM